jgi:hypothetical protein
MEDPDWDSEGTNKNEENNVTPYSYWFVQGAAPHFLPLLLHPKKTKKNRYW